MRLSTDYLALEPNPKITFSHLSSHIGQRNFLEQVKPGFLAPTFTAAYLPESPALSATVCGISGDVSVSFEKGIYFHAFTGSVLSLVMVVSSLFP